MRRLFKTSLLIGLLALSTSSLAPAAEPKDTTLTNSFALARVMVSTGQLSVGGTYLAFLARIDGADTKSDTFLVPFDIPPTIDYYIGGAPQSAGLGEPKFFGCIFVSVTGKGVDGGCQLRRGSTITFDPALQKGIVTFSVDSSAVAGRQVTANLILNGKTSAASVVPFTYLACTFATTFSSSPCAINPAAPQPPAATAARPTTVVLDAAAGMLRDSTVIGTVRSDVVGGGGIKSSDTAMIQGVGGKIDLQRAHKVICLRQGDPEVETCYA